MQNPSQMPDANALKALLSSGETRRLIDLLRRQGDLNGAAQRAKDGDTEPLRRMLSQLQSSPEGSQALSAIERQLK